VNNVNSETHVYLTWTADGIDSQEQHGKDIYFVRSTDGGQNWEKPYRLNNDEMNKKISNFYPNITTSPQGKVIVSWYDRRKDNNDIKTDHFIAVSNDYGESFGKNIEVSTQSTDFETVGLINQGFGIGEYNAIVANDNYAFAIWADGRSGNGNLDVYCARIDLNDMTSVERVQQINSDIMINNIYPNPTKSELNLNFTNKTPKNIIISIKDLNGNNIITVDNSLYQSGEHNIKMDLSSIPSLNYYLHFEFENGFEVRKVKVVR
jgi:hypothetical protein